ncbi:phosphoribosylaminoimidazolesuccinocarboxamide synthase [Candidatus Roizmanbacteria bacterium]|nr:phosphoribosylaminoimidazolesuccinocarboxamide synthase [Candidatus Roizmanbacteria bacterium]
MSDELIQAQLPDSFDEFIVPPHWGIEKTQGKVGENLDLGNEELAIIRTDRKSAFDQVLGAVPSTGEINNRVSNFWFRLFKEEGGPANHYIEEIDPNATVVKKAARRLPVEVIVRGYITGETSTALWRLYSEGARDIYGHHFRDGYQKGDLLDEPVITPTTKAEKGQHDERLTCDEVVERGLVDAETWEKVQTDALYMFKRAQEVALAHGLILMDTKMEFGFDKDGNLMVIDELFTGDSSRFVLASTYHDNMAQGIDLDHQDKEYLRLAYSRATGYKGGAAEAPAIPEPIVFETARRYIRLIEMLTGEPFVVNFDDPQKRIARNIEDYMQRRQAA